MAYKVKLSDEAKAFLEGLAKADKQSCTDLAILLTRLARDPHPLGRPLDSLVERDASERTWTYGEFEILYRLDEGRKEVLVGPIKNLKT